MIHTGHLKFPHVIFHSADDLIVIFIGDFRICHIPAGQFLRQNLIEDRVFVQADRLVDTAFGVGSGGDGNAVPIFREASQLGAAA